MQAVAAEQTCLIRHSLTQAVDGVHLDQEMDEEVSQKWIGISDNRIVLASLTLSCIKIAEEPRKGRQTSM
jgi:hypothetical protein